jgi:hypothetical protein
MAPTVTIKYRGGATRVFEGNLMARAVAVLHASNWPWLTRDTLNARLFARPGELDVFFGSNSVCYTKRDSEAANRATFFKRTGSFGVVYYRLCVTVLKVQPGHTSSSSSSSSSSASPTPTTTHAAVKTEDLQHQHPPLRHPQPVRRAFVHLTQLGKGLTPATPPSEGQQQQQRRVTVPPAPKKASPTSRVGPGPNAKSCARPLPRTTLAATDDEARRLAALKRKRDHDGEVDDDDSSDDDDDSSSSSPDSDLDSGSSSDDSGSSSDSDSDSSSDSDSDSGSGRPTKHKKRRVDPYELIDEERAMRAFSRSFVRENQLASKQIGLGGKKRDKKKKEKKHGIMSDKTKTICGACGRPFVGKFGLKIHHGRNPACKPKANGSSSSSSSSKPKASASPDSAAAIAVAVHEKKNSAPAPAAAPIPRMYHFSVPMASAKVTSDGPKVTVSFNLSDEHTAWTMD